MGGLDFPKLNDRHTTITLLLELIHCINEYTHVFWFCRQQPKRTEFLWSPEFEGLILNGFNIGFVFSPIIGGHIAGMFGGKRVVMVALLVGSVATICLPLAARLNDIFVIVLRIVTGIFLVSKLGLELTVTNNSAMTILLLLFLLLLLLFA